MAATALARGLSDTLDAVGLLTVAPAVIVAVLLRDRPGRLVIGRLAAGKTPRSATPRRSVTYSRALLKPVRGQFPAGPTTWLQTGHAGCATGSKVRLVQA